MFGAWPLPLWHVLATSSIAHSQSSGYSGQSHHAQSPSPPTSKMIGVDGTTPFRIFVAMSASKSGLMITEFVSSSQPPWDRYISMRNS